MIYLVSGWMRSGTTMMARALDVGGLAVVRSASRDRFNDCHSDGFYRPNPDSLYEVEPGDMLRPGFPLHHEGKAVKVVVPFLKRLKICPSGYRVIFMRRDPQEIVESYHAAFARSHYAYWPFGPNDHSPVELSQPVPTRTIVDKQVTAALQYLRNRRDVHEVRELWYREVLAAPRTAFKSLQADGWPIDAKRASSVVDRKLCRFKRELLTVGA